jgi:hypothetical protein
VTRLGDVRFPHLVDPLLIMFFQAIIGVSLETLKNFCIGSLYLAIALWVSNGGISDFYAKIFTLPLECTVGELGPIVSDDPV